VKSLRASFHGPLARVAINTAGPVLVLYFLVTVLAFTVAGIVWWAAAALALGPTLIVAGMAVVGFRTVARRCSRCGDWAELVEDGAGQKLCARCWQVIAGPPPNWS
jgi:hypothetical protein